MNRQIRVKRIDKYDLGDTIPGFALDAEDITVDDTKFDFSSYTDKSVDIHIGAGTSNADSRDTLTGGAGSDTLRAGRGGDSFDWRCG